MMDVGLVSGPDGDDFEDMPEHVPHKQHFASFDVFASVAVMRVFFAAMRYSGLLKNKTLKTEVRRWYENEVKYEQKGVLGAISAKKKKMKAD